MISNRNLRFGSGTKPKILGKPKLITFPDAICSQAPRPINLMRISVMNYSKKTFLTHINYQLTISKLTRCMGTTYLMLKDLCQGTPMMPGLTKI